MPGDMRYLGPPGPVDVRRSASAVVLRQLVRGVSSYARPYLGNVPAMPALQRFRQPASVQADIELTELYAADPLLFRQRLQSMFVDQARARTGR